MSRAAAPQAGHPGEEPPAPLCQAADRALAALCSSSGSAHLDGITGHGLLTERARLLGLSFAAGRSPGGFCRLLPARGDVLAVNLPRDCDWEMIPAWLEVAACRPGDWAAVAQLVSRRASDQLLSRARTLGLPVAPCSAPVAPVLLQVEGAPLPPLSPRPPPDAARRPRVIDLSGLWAGPLCSHLLHLCGADVIKVESLERPDGARAGDASFYGLLNQGKRSVALDFAAPSGRRTLAALIARADIVIEAARPRALKQLGIDAGQMVADHGLTWLSITGYGRSEPQANWVAFGDDAAVAAGLAAAMREAVGTFQFPGDALADPLTGIHAALAGWRAWRSGGRRLVALTLAGVAAASLADARQAGGATGLHEELRSWWRHVEGRRLAPASGSRRIHEPVAALGADTRAVVAELGLPC